MNSTAKYDLFISYRRDGGVDYARMIYLELKGRGYNTFFDYNSLRDGKFNEGIFKAIDECQYFILVLSSGALDRCLNEDDWVRHEIEYAMSQNKAIIPICPSGCIRGFPEKMPDSFAPLRNLQISMLQMDDLFDKSFDKIVEDRFAAEFREGRAPIPASGGVTSKVFKRIGIGVIVAIIAAAGIIGITTVRSREAEKARAEHSRQLTEKMLTQAAEEKKAADAAKEKAQQDAIRAQKAQAQIEAEMRAKEKTEVELRAAREAKIRAEAESKAARASGGMMKESDAVRKLVLRESDIKAKLIPAETEVASLKKEVDRLEHTGINSALDADAARREEEDNRRAASRTREKMTNLEKSVAKWKDELAVIQESIVRTRAIDAAYHGAANSGVTVEKLEEVKLELDCIVKRMVARRVKAKSLGDAVPTTRLSDAEQAYAVFAAEKGSLVDALKKAKAADAAYADILDKVVRDKISSVEKAADRYSEDRRWNVMLQLINQHVAPIDPENEYFKKVYADIAGHVAPTAVFTAELNGVSVNAAKLYVNGKLEPLPYRHIFSRGDDGAYGKGQGNIIKLESVVVSYEESGKRYVAKKYGLSPTWKGETNIVLRLKEDLRAGTTVKITLGRFMKSLEDMGCVRHGDWETPIEMVWCPGGTELIKYKDPDSDSEKEVVKVFEPGFAIKGKKEQGGFKLNKVSRNDVDLDMPYTAQFDTLARDLFGSLSTVRIIDGTFFWDGMSFDMPTVGEWIRAARFEGFMPTEDDFGKYAWCIENADTNKMLHVGQKDPSKLGLLDVYGNVSEWCQGSLLEWLGLEKKEEVRGRVMGCRMGGGCVDDFESSVDIAKKLGRQEDQAGIRLKGMSMFEYESSIVEWVSIHDDFDSGDEAKIKSAMEKLKMLAKESDDDELRENAQRQYIARGGDVTAVGGEMTKDVRMMLVRKTTDAKELIKYATEDEDPGVRREAFEKLEEPSPDIVVKYMCGLKDVYEESRNSKKVNAALFYMFNRDPKLSPELLAMIALKAKCPNFRSQAIEKVSDQAVLKEVALNDDSIGNVFAAIEKITSRTALMEIRQKTKKKNVRSAVRDRLEKLSE